MSWASYVDNMMALAGGHISKGAIIGLDGGLWTAVAGDHLLAVTAQEASVLAEALKTRNTLVIQKQFQTGGINIAGQRYMFVRDLYEDGRVILGKKANEGAVTLQVTNLAVVIALTPNGKEQRAATNAVNTIADYLQKANY